MTQTQTGLQIGRLMEESGVKFGTSGARGPVTAMTDRVCYAYTQAFLQYLRSRGPLEGGGRVALGGDLRASTGRILEAVATAVVDAGQVPIYLGRLPSPALASYGLREGVPSAMVTGSHIPDDRNGIKYNTASGEILKADEAGIRAQTVELPAGRFGPDGALRPASPALPEETPEGLAHYVARYLDFYPDACLDGLRVGLYEHSSVAREALYQVLTGLGARVERLARSDRFVPVDTEAIRAEDVALAREWAAGGGYDAIVSTDGDGDRPLISDEQGRWLRGDVAGILCAAYLRADAVVTPVSSNTAVERAGLFATVRRTRIGSPYVIAGMQEAVQEGYHRVVGYEANGGFLTATPLERDDRVLDPLPTRDTLVVIASLLLAAREQGLPISGLVAGLPPRYTASDRIRDFPTERSQALLAELYTGEAERDRVAIAAALDHCFGEVAEVDVTDGLRVTFESGEIVHLRPSGNAPELRCYNEADDEARAWEMNRRCMAILHGWRDRA